MLLMAIEPQFQNAVAFHKKVVMQVDADSEVPEENVKVIPLQPTPTEEDFEEKLLKVQKDLIDFLKEEGE
jgi:hypothetical protein